MLGTSCIHVIPHFRSKNKIPDVLLVSHKSLQLQICKDLDSCRKICGAYRCFDRPQYIGEQWGDIFLHVCWFVGIMWWLPVIIGFICCCFIELFRRAKLVEVRLYTNASYCYFLTRMCRLGLIFSDTVVTGCCGSS